MTIPRRSGYFWEEAEIARLIKAAVVGVPRTADDFPQSQSNSMQQSLPPRARLSEWPCPWPWSPGDTRPVASIAYRLRFKAATTSGHTDWSRPVSYTHLTLPT